MRNAYWKLTIAFWNTTYLKIIWSVLHFQSKSITHFRECAKKSILPNFTQFCPKIPESSQNEPKTNKPWLKPIIISYSTTNFTIICRIKRCYLGFKFLHICFSEILWWKCENPLPALGINSTKMSNTQWYLCKWQINC